MCNMCGRGVSHKCRCNVRHENVLYVTSVRGVSCVTCVVVISNPSVDAMYNTLHNTLQHTLTHCDTLQHTI